ncbi:type IV secretion system DNA-binding domain-containing protein [Escherichia coli]|nr:type IV secretion system DNA-binding domain-containing protein [Escherichia coli]
MLKKTARTPISGLATCRLSGSEIQNFCLHGTVGAGKSEVIRRLANYARQRGDMVVIYDRSGEFVKVTMIPPSIKS